MPRKDRQQDVYNSKHTNETAYTLPSPAGKAARFLRSNLRPGLSPAHLFENVPHAHSLRDEVRAFRFIRHQHRGQLLGLLHDPWHTADGQQLLDQCIPISTEDLTEVTEKHAKQRNGTSGPIRKAHPQDWPLSQLFEILASHTAGVCQRAHAPPPHTNETTTLNRYATDFSLRFSYTRIGCSWPLPTCYSTPSMPCACIPTPNSDNPDSSPDST